MARVSPELLASCLTDLESGRRTVDQCVAAHPESADELCALLLIAGAIPKAPLVTPDLQFRVRTRSALINAIVEQKAHRRSWWKILFGSPARAPGILQRLTMPVTVLAVVAAMTGVTGGTAVLAARGTLPGDVLYPLKTTVEELQVSLVVGDEAKAEAYLELASRRLSEIVQARQAGRPAASSAAADTFNKQVAKAEKLLARAEASGKDVQVLATRLNDQLARHETSLVKVVTEGVAADQDALSTARKAGQKGLGRSGQDSSQDDVTAGESPQVSRGKGDTNDQQMEEIAGSAAVTVTQAIAQVQQLAVDDKVSGQNYEGLLAKLRAAQAAIVRGQPDVAARTLDAFVAELNAIQRVGHISRQNYDALYAKYSTAASSLDSLKAGKGGPQGFGIESQPPDSPAEQEKDESNNRPDQRGVANPARGKQ